MDRALSTDRLRWHCRRGLLELDLVLKRFVERELESLDEVQRALFADMLAIEDLELWDLLSGRAECNDSRLREMVDRVRSV